MLLGRLGTGSPADVRAEARVRRGAQGLERSGERRRRLGGEYFATRDATGDRVGGADGLLRGRTRAGGEADAGEVDVRSIRGVGDAAQEGDPERAAELARGVVDGRADPR